MTTLLILLAVYAVFWFLTLPVRTWYAYLTVMALDYGDEMPYEWPGMVPLFRNWQQWPKAYVLTRALLLDALLNATWGAALCLDFTLRDRVLTKRMQRYLRTPPVSGWLGAHRLHVAKHICKHLLDPYAKGGCHC